MWIADDQAAVASEVRIFGGTLFSSFARRCNTSVRMLHLSCNDHALAFLCQGGLKGTAGGRCTGVPSMLPTCLFRLGALRLLYPRRIVINYFLTTNHGRLRRK
jgi:hypothetical protein